MMTRLKTALMIAVISGLCIGGLPASAATDFDKGADLYAKGQFLAASDAFVDAICANPDHYPAHYALANSYMKLGKMDQAQTEYEMCLERYPDKITRANCQKALAYLNGTTKGMAVASRHSAQLDAMLATEGQQRSAKAQAAATQQRTALEKNAQKSAEKFKDNAKAQLEAMKKNSAWWSVDRELGEIVPIVPRETEEHLFEVAEKQGQLAKMSAKAKADAIQPSLGTTDVTDGLRSQIDARGHSSVRLSPVGTNVYVRNYESAQVAGKAGGVK